MSDINVTVELPESLAREYVDGFGRAGWQTSLVYRVRDIIAAALPKPKPDEPLYLGAVVRDEGRVWVRADDSDRPSRWVCWSNWVSWSDFSDAVEVLSPGWAGADNE